MHYLERKPIVRDNRKRRLLGLGCCFRQRPTQSSGNNDNSDTFVDVPTVIICHGLSDSAQNMAGFIHSLDIPDHVRILAPDQIGHGKDLERAKSHPDLYEHPTQLTLLESTSEFLDAVNVGSNTNAFGISLGGGLAYYLRLKRPDVIQKTVLVSPAIPFCINHTYMDDFVGGRKNFMCFEDRQDVKHLFRDLSTGQENNDKRLKKDPVPTFFLEAIYRANKKTAPEGHYRDMLHGLLVILNEDHAKSSEGEEKDMSKMMTAEQDIDKESQRLVLWPEEDRIVSYQNGKHFFEDSLIPGEENEIIKSGGRTRFVSIPDCGHVFHADGTIILAIDWVRNEIRNFLIDLAPEMESRS